MLFMLDVCFYLLECFLVSVVVIICWLGVLLGLFCFELV